jgi:hypothetical protein
VDDSQSTYLTNLRNENPDVHCGYNPKIGGNFFEKRIVVIFCWNRHKNRTFELALFFLVRSGTELTSFCLNRHKNQTLN